MYDAIIFDVDSDEIHEILRKIKRNSDENVNKSFGDIFKETLEEELNGKSDIESKMIINSLVKYLNESLMCLKDLKDDFNSQNDDN